MGGWSFSSSRKFCLESPILQGPRELAKGFIKRWKNLDNKEKDKYKAKAIKINQ